MPYFSVVIPTYNRAKLVCRAIESVLMQTFTDFEIIVVDDGSTDDTRKVLEKFSADPRFHYVYQENAKESAARNRGMDKATGNYVCFLDSDDVYMPVHLNTLKRVVEENNHLKAFYHTFCEIENEKGERRKKQEKYIPVDSGIYSLYVNRALTNTVCIPNEVAKKYKFREDIYIDEDAELFYRIATDFPVITVPEYTALCYEHGDNTKDQIKTPHFYRNKIISLRIYLASPAIMNAFPEGFFEGRMARTMRWFAQSLIQYGEPAEARKAMFEACKYDNSSKWSWENIQFALKSFLKR